ncbi:MAG TPA: hypothetical protein PKK48_07345, partial [Phycisphaerae bacterium]|nr:hypothetical protein [Phycisphaerae bacterium]
MPYGSVILSNGVLYGTTVGVSSSSGGGTVYKLNTDGSDFEVLHSFTSSTDGIEVYNGLTLVDGNIYGIARNGGSAGCGVLFKIDSSSAFSVIHNFTGSGEGSYPYTAPTYYNGSLYGLTWGGWASGTSNIYQYNLSTGTYTSLYNMTSPGVQPFGTVTVINGYLYGMNSDNRDTANHGNIFKYNLDSGSYEIVHTFAGGTSGGYPYDSLVWDGGTYVYGTTMGYAVWSEDNEESTPKRSEELADEGVVFRLNIETNEYTVLHDFSAQTGDGAKPNSSMLIAPDGWLYGIAHGNEIWGGTEYGTLYRMRLDGSDFEVLHVFDSMEDGNVPMRSIIWDDGIIYGTTAYGGYGTGDGYGTVWMFNTLVP